MPKIKRSQRGSTSVKAEPVDATELAKEEARLAKTLRDLQKLAEDKKNKKEFIEKLTEAEKRHRKKLLKGKVDHDYEGLLDKGILDAKKQLRKLKEQLELKKPEHFVALTAAGKRPPRERNTVLFITPAELCTIIHALRYTQNSFEILRPGSTSYVDAVDRDIGKGKLTAYLLRAAIEAGVGWATPAAPHIRDEDYAVVSI